MTMGSEGMTGWTDGSAPSADVCEHFQIDLSCLVDGELNDDAAAARAMLHLEDCDDCRSFFDETRNCVRLHRDMADPDRLLARITTLTGADLAAEAQTIELVHRLATIFYQLGKAYVLAAIDPDYHLRVFEKAVPLDYTHSRGRGFVDGVLLAGQAAPGAVLGGVDWDEARHMLNGRLKQIATPLEKGRKLLEEAVEADPSHEEARLYLAFLHAHEGKVIQAVEEYTEVFHQALNEQNRGHAAVQLGRLHEAEGNHRKALKFFRWVSMSGVAERDERFYFVHFNIGLQYALLRDRRRALAAFRRLIELHPERVSEIAGHFTRAQSLRAAVESDPRFAEELVATCPELFQGSSQEEDPDVHES